MDMMHIHELIKANHCAEHRKAEREREREWGGNWGGLTERCVHVCLYHSEFQHDV